VVEFVRDKLRELLGLRPEVFAVSARQAAKAKAAGMAPDERTTGFGALEAYLTRTLDDAERLRVKLQSPLGVAEHVLDQTEGAVKARLAAVNEDEAALKEVEVLRVQQLADATRDLRLRLAEAERPFVELEKRGDAHLEQALRTTGTLRLLDASRTAKGYRQEVLAGLAAAVDRRAEGVVDAIVTGEGRLWPAVAERLERRRKAHGTRLDGPKLQAPVPDRARLVQSLGRDCHRALDGFDAAAESARLGGVARLAALATLLLGSAALAAAGLGLARASTAGAALPWLVAALGFGVAALLPLGLLRSSERRRFAQTAASVRQRFAGALRSGFERELEASQQRVQDAVAPFSRHVRSEIERLRAQAYEVGARRKDMEALRAQIAAMR
jgi:hypothetical protein